MSKRNTGLYAFFGILFFSIVTTSMLLSGCKSNSVFQSTGDTIADGKVLVQKYCTKCHAEVDPKLLTKDVWNFHTLPTMSRYLALSTFSQTNYYKKPTDTGGVSLDEWLIIRTYFNKLAPNELPAIKEPQPLLNDWAGFTLRKPQAEDKVVHTSMVAYDSLNSKLYTSDLVSTKLTEWDANLKPHVVAELPSAPVDATFLKGINGQNEAIFSCIGQIIPMDFPNGKVLSLDLDGKTAGSKPSVIQEDLGRPVQALAGDFNKDGLTDYVILSQGHFVGGVYLMKQKSDHTFTQSNISDKPGAVQAIVGDFNHDGWPDLMVLYGSGEEGLWLYTNNHKGGFSGKSLINFPAVYGSSSFQLVDINHDGKLDLIYTCGYNYKDSRILKPYHGLYIFTNQGDWNFKQAYYYPINGTTKAIAADFDGDGDLDIAAISFFADLKGNPAESFIYFEQDKPMSFKPHAIPVSKYGHWMNMTVADINHDGKPDIILGNYADGLLIQDGLKPFWDQHVPFVILENHTKK